MKAERYWVPSSVHAEGGVLLEVGKTYRVVSRTPSRYYTIGDAQQIVEISAIAFNTHNTLVTLFFKLSHGYNGTRSTCITLDTQNLVPDYEFYPSPGVPKPAPRCCSRCDKPECTGCPTHCPPPTPAYRLVNKIPGIQMNGGMLWLEVGRSYTSAAYGDGTPFVKYQNYPRYADYDHFRINSIEVHDERGITRLCVTRTNGYKDTIQLASEPNERYSRFRRHFRYA